MKTLVKLPKNITFSLPSDTVKEVLAAAKEDHKTVNEWLKDVAHRSLAKKQLLRLAAKTQKYVKKHKITPEDLGGPFAE
jgi:hypothetical protein